MPDMYVDLVCKALQLNPEQVDPEMRQRIKSVLFSWSYGSRPQTEDSAIQLLQMSAEYVLRGVTVTIGDHNGETV